MNPSNAPRILTTTVGSYPVPDWLAALPSEQALLDATRVVFNVQRQAGIDLPTDGGTVSGPILPSRVELEFLCFLWQSSFCAAQNPPIGC